MKNNWVVGVAVGMGALALPAGVGRAAGPQYEVVFLGPAGPQHGASGSSGGQQVGTVGSHAVLWHGSAESMVDLHPGLGFTYSSGLDTDGHQQVGIGGAPDGNSHALLWHGSAASFVDLHPIGFESSRASGVAGGEQVGFGTLASLGGAPHALLWSGSADSVVDLHPAAYYQSAIGNTDGTRQTGYAHTRDLEGFAGERHAMIWSGTATSALDIHPIGARASAANAVDGDLVGGAASFRIGSTDAVLWNLANGNLTNLAPAWAWSSEVAAVAGGYQAGNAYDGRNHAMVWKGTAASSIDLHEYLPPEYAASAAFDVDALGNVVGYANIGDGWQPVMWVIVPEPPFSCLLTISLAFIGRRRRDFA